MSRFLYTEGLLRDIRDRLDREERFARDREQRHREEAANSQALIEELHRVLAAVQGEAPSGRITDTPREDYEKAKKIFLSDYSGVMLKNPADIGGNDGKGYIPVNDILCYQSELRDGWAWACTERYLVIDAYDVLETALDSGEWYENAISDFDVAGLQMLLDKWLDKNSGTVCYIPDHSLVVQIPSARNDL